MKELQVGELVLREIMEPSFLSAPFPNIRYTLYMYENRLYVPQLLVLRVWDTEYNSTAIGGSSILEK